MTDDIDNFARVLRELRGDTQQKDLAAALGCTQSAISQWEGGQRFPGMEGVIRIADHFGVSIDYMLGRSKSA